MSTMGVPSIASSGPTASSRPSIPSTVTSCQPSGSGDPTSESQRHRQRPRLVVTQMHLQDVRSAEMRPRHETSQVAHEDPLERVRDGQIQGDERMGARPLPWRGASSRRTKDGRDKADRLQHVAVLCHSSRYLSCAIRIWLPDGSRKPASMPYACLVGSCWNSTPRPLSSSYLPWTSSVAKKRPPAAPLEISSLSLRARLFVEHGRARDGHQRDARRPAARARRR